MADAGGLFGGAARDRERLLDRFEAAWRDGPPDLARFVREHVTAGSPDRGETLAELAQTDLELRIKRGDDARAEDYLGRFPEIAADADRAADLIAAEFRLRSRHRVPPTVAELARRFPEFAGRLRHLIGDGPAAEPRAPEAGGPAAFPGYDDLRPLGSGRLGPRFRAVCTTTGADVTVKRIDAAGGAGRVATFVAETARRASVAGRTLLRPCDIGLAGGRPYVVTPFVSAVPFERIAAADPADDRPRIAVLVVGRLLSALAPLHRVGLTHGGLTPADVLLEPAAGGARVKLTDFGLARLFSEPDDAAAGLAGDLAAVGELLRGYLVGGDGELPAGIDRVVRRATDPDPDFRFADADEFRRALRPFARRS